MVLYLKRYQRSVYCLALIPIVVLNTLVAYNVLTCSLMFSCLSLVTSLFSLLSVASSLCSLAVLASSSLKLVAERLEGEGCTMYSLLHITSASRDKQCKECRANEKAQKNKTKLALGLLNGPSITKEIQIS